MVFPAFLGLLQHSPVQSVGQTSLAMVIPNCSPKYLPIRDPMNLTR